MGNPPFGTDAVFLSFYRWLSVSSSGGRPTGASVRRRGQHRPPIQLRQTCGVSKGSARAGLGSDFDGIPTYVDGLEDVSTFPALLSELSRRGWSDEDLRKVAGENLLRVMQDAEAVASRLTGAGA
ncbi:MAG: membrane dipeptidase [Gemmatimonadetes bacterium]|nr:membrane dipeptidase [Gemmatimonadota bacterium]